MIARILRIHQRIAKVSHDLKKVELIKPATKNFRYYKYYKRHLHQLAGISIEILMWQILNGAPESD